MQLSFWSADELPPHGGNRGDHEGSLPRTRYSRSGLSEVDADRHAVAARRSRFLLLPTLHRPRVFAGRTRASDRRGTAGGGAKMQREYAELRMKSFAASKRAVEYCFTGRNRKKGAVDVIQPLSW